MIKKRLFVVVGVLLGLSSCKNYMISTVASKNTIQSPETGKFTMENDSLAFGYSFAGPNLPINIEIKNKLGEPMFVDWERSAVVLGNKTYSFVDDKVYVNADVSGTVNKDYYTPVISYNYQSDVKGTAQLSTLKSFIPPGATVTRAIQSLSNGKDIKLPKSDFQKVYLEGDVSLGSVKVAKASFEPLNSPVQFQCFITVYTLKDNVPQSAYYKHDFYVSDITKTSVNPSSIYVFRNQKDANSIIGNYTGFAKTMFVVGTVGLMGAAAAVHDATSETSNLSAK